MRWNLVCPLIILMVQLVRAAWPSAKLEPIARPAECPLVELAGEGIRCAGSTENGDRISLEGRRGRMHPDRLASLGIPIDLNRASQAELEGLPGVGPALARRIIEARPFAQVPDLERVSGIGPKKLAALVSRVLVR